MTEWLTTGEMIDRLKVGEVAVSADEGFKVRNEGGHFMYSVDEINGTCSGDYFRITCVTNRLKWRILPNYVTFEEAMKAHKNNKTVYFHDEWDTAYKLTPDESIHRIGATLLECHSFLTLWEGKWSIEGDTHA